jgi:drug/metabolite transporter (DMT)-like permease
MAQEARPAAQRIGKPSSHLAATLQALLVTFLWSTSWVLIKIGLDEIPALTFAGLRYGLAFLILLPVAQRSGRLALLPELSRAGWLRLALLGVVGFGVTQGSQFLGLAYLEAVTVTLLLNFTSILVALFALLALKEQTSGLQWIGIVLFLSGVVAYFGPVAFQAQEVTGLFIVIIGVVANAASSVLGRHINREGVLPPLAVTVVSMGVGAVILLVAGVALQGLPQLSLKSWLIIGWLAAVNSAFAFTLWNHTQRTLPAVESSIINNTMLIQIAVLAWLFLGETLDGRELVGLGLAAAGALLVQLRRGRAGGPR